MNTLCYSEKSKIAIANGLFDIGAVLFGEFTMVSGLKTPIYFDLRRLMSSPLLLRRVAQSLAEILYRLKFDRIAAIPQAGVPIGTAVCLYMDQPLIYTRKEIKDHGTKKKIEGIFNKGERVVLLDDLITKADSKLEAIEIIKNEGLIISDVVVLVDREQGGREELERRGHKLHSAFTLRELLKILVDNEKIKMKVMKETIRKLKL